MKRIPVLLILLLPVLVKSQSSFKVIAGTKTGFEYNVYNAHESRIFISEEGDTSSAIQSGLFQQFSLQADWKKQFKKHRISLGGKARYDLFPVLAEANLFRPEARLNYAFRVNKNQSVIFKSRYIMHRTDGIPDETTVLTLPRGYQRWQSDLGYKFRPFDNNRSQVQLSVFRKIYQPEEYRYLMYDAFQLNFKTKQRFKQKGKPSQYLTLEFDFVNRNYLDERFMEGEGEEEELEALIKDRKWQYQTVDVEYSFSPSKKVRWKPGISIQQRMDILDEKFGYRQIEPYLKFGYEEERMSLDLKLQTTFRYYTELEAAGNSEELLRHQYLRVGMDFKYALNEQWDLTVKGNLRKRWRNLSDQATNFLPYANGVFSVGLNYCFKE